MEQVDVNLVSTAGRIRSVSDNQVKVLASSIGEVGLLNPITVYRASIVRGGLNLDGFKLIAGAHRLAACRNLGWSHIPAVVVDLNEHQRTIAECDENLCGTQLSLAERADFTARRKFAYDALHPEDRYAKGGKARWSGATETHSVAPGFAKETAERTGKSERVVFKDVERGTKINATALDMVKGTKLDTARYLDKLKDMPAAAQIRSVERDLTAEKPTRSDRSDDDYTRLLAAWDRASLSTRARFLSHIRDAA